MRRILKFVRWMSDSQNISQRTVQCIAATLVIGVAGCAVSETAVLVEDGVAGEVLITSDRWQSKDGALVGSGTGHRLGPAFVFEPGDCTVTIRLSLDALDATAASFAIDGNSHFGFDSRSGNMFIEGPVFGGQTRTIATTADHITAGEVFEFVVQRRGDTLRFIINDTVAYEQEDDRAALGRIALRPHRATMRIVSWNIGGNLGHIVVPDAVDAVDVFVRGEDGYHTFRIPAIIKAANGDLLAFAEGRVNGGGDSGNIDIVMKRSSDDGATWGAMEVVGGFGDGCLGNPAPVVDQATGDVVLLGVLQPEGAHEGHIRNDQGGYRDPCVLRSTDHGQTWSEPVSLFETADRADWRWYATGPCHGIQLQHGEHAGRLVIPANFSVVGSGGNNQLGAHALLSDDGGDTWRIGAVDDTHVGENEINPNESTVVELADGRLMFNCRDQGGSSRATRAVTFSEDGGETFVNPYAADERLVAPVCQGALLGIDTDAGQLVVFSAPGVWDGRRQMQLRYSNDAGDTWHDGPILNTGSAAYSDLVGLGNDAIGSLYEADGYARIVFARVPLGAMTNGQ